MEPVIFSRQGHLGVMTLNRPQALNALNLEMIKAMQQQLLQWQTDSTVHAVVLKGAGDRAFCAGGDVRWLYEAGRNRDPQQLQFFWHEYRLNEFISRFTKPYIVLMDGITMGGGVGISLHGSFAIASERFVFAMPETAIGLFPDIGACYLLARCPGALGMYLGLTGQRLNAKQALAAGLIKYSIPANQFDAFIDLLTNRDLSVEANSQIKASLQSFASFEQNETRLDLAMINDYFSEASLKHILKKLQSSDSPWAIATLNDLQQKSPISLEITFTRIQQAKCQSLAECLQADYQLIQKVIASPDFYEGIRAALIDKDKQPCWQPASLDAITTADIDQYFTMPSTLDFGDC